MAIVGFNFSKIEAERKTTPSGELSIKNNVSLTDVKESDISLGSEKQKAVKFLFEFVTVYEPDLGEIKLSGEVIHVDDEKNIKDLLKHWKDKKEVSKELRNPILNMILAKSNIQSLILSQDINLPPPIQMPRIKEDEK